MAEVLIIAAAGAAVGVAVPVAAVWPLRNRRPAWLVRHGPGWDHVQLALPSREDPRR